MDISSKGTVDDLAQRYMEVCAENERLRAALQAIVDVYEAQDERAADLRMATIARQSLIK